jgi:hypothetical protein
VRLEGLGKLKEFNETIGTRARDLPAYSIIHQQFTLPCTSTSYKRQSYLKAYDRLPDTLPLKDEQNKQTNSLVSVRERTIPTERPPLLGEVVANFCG